MNTTHNEHRRVMEEGREYVKAHLAECAREMLEWYDTALLRDGRMRELAKILKPISPNYDSLGLAESLVRRAALELAARCEANP